MPNVNLPGWSGRTVAQLVTDASGGNVRALPQDGRAFAEFEKPEEGQYVPALGSADLLRLALWAVDHGNRLLHVELRDRSMSPLPEGVNDEVEETLVDAVSAHDLLTARTALDGDRGPYTIVSIEVETPKARDLRVSRNGEAEGDTTDAVVDFIRPAWSELALT